MAAVESMEEWIRTVLEEGRCMDCTVTLDEGDRTLEFRGSLPHHECVGHLCTPCWERRETLRRMWIQTA